MKVRASAKAMCKDCRLIIRSNGAGKKTRRIICKIPKHKQRQG